MALTSLLSEWRDAAAACLEWLQPSYASLQSLACLSFSGTYFSFLSSCVWIFTAISMSLCSFRLVIDQPYCPVLDAPVTSSPGSSTCVIGDQSEINWHNISLQFDGATGGLTVTRFEEPVLEAEVANFSAQCSNSISKTLNCSHTDDEVSLLLSCLHPYHPTTLAPSLPSLPF